MYAAGPGSINCANQIDCSAHNKLPFLDFIEMIFYFYFLLTGKVKSPVFTVRMS